MATKIVKKISTKIVCGTVKAPKHGEVRPLMRVGGMANGVKKGSTDKGDWIALTGSFVARAYNEDGSLADDEYRAGTCFMPDVAVELIAGQIQEGVNVTFGFDINVKGDETAIVNYVYEAEPLIEAAEDDPMEQLADTLMDKPLAISGPKSKAKAKAA